MMKFVKKPLPILQQKHTTHGHLIHVHTHMMLLRTIMLQKKKLNWNCSFFEKKSKNTSANLGKTKKKKQKLIYTKMSFVSSFRHTFVPWRGAQRAKISEKVHKPPLGVNVINFELNGFNAFIWIPWSPSDTKML